MSRRHCTHLARVAGISVAALGIGLVVSACSSTASSPAAAPVATTPVATTPVATASPASTAPASAPASTATGVAPTAAQASAAASTPAATPVVTAANATPVDVNGKPFVVWDCDGEPQVEPATFVISCADDGTGWSAVHWTKWGEASAAGVGTQYWKNCVPNCAEGKILDLPVDIALTGSYLPAQNEPFSYTKVTFTYTTSARPTVYVTVNGKVEATHPATWTLELPPPPASHPTSS